MLSQVEQRGISLRILHSRLLIHLLKFHFMHVTSDGAFRVFHWVETKHFASLPCCCFFPQTCSEVWHNFETGLKFTKDVKNLWDTEPVSCTPGALRLGFTWSKCDYCYMKVNKVISSLSAFLWWQMFKAKSGFRFQKAASPDELMIVETSVSSLASNAGPDCFWLLCRCRRGLAQKALEASCHFSLECFLSESRKRQLCFPPTRRGPASMPPRSATVTMHNHAAAESLSGTSGSNIDACSYLSGHK